jgi:hypothetical protein
MIDYFKHLMFMLPMFFIKSKIFFFDFLLLFIIEIFSSNKTKSLTQEHHHQTPSQTPSTARLTTIP